MSLFRGLITMLLATVVTANSVSISMAAEESGTLQAFPSGSYSNFKLEVDGPGVFVVELGGAVSHCTSLGQGCTMEWSGSFSLPTTIVNVGQTISGELTFQMDSSTRSVLWIIMVAVGVGGIAVVCCIIALCRRSSRREVTTGIMVAAPPQQYYGTGITQVEGVVVSAPLNTQQQTVIVSRH